MKAILGIVFAASFSMLAHADIKPVSLKSTKGRIAIQASNVFSVSYHDIGDDAYKVVSMDSRLNGDLSATGFIIVGEKAVGGAAGFDHAFLMTPKDEWLSISNATVVNGALQVEYFKLDGTTDKRSYAYDRTKKVLVEK